MPDVSVDGYWDDWNPGGWHSFDSVVYGRSDGILKATFQTGWNEEGLLVGISVLDDIRKAPATRLEQNFYNDSIEILLDTNLADDFAASALSNDDFQIVVDINGTAFLHFPTAQKRAIQVTSRFLPIDNGYNGEILIPWELLGINRVNLRSGLNFGFSLAVSDNDTDGLIQERLIATSPTRRFPPNPTQWGMLTLGGFVAAVGGVSNPVVANPTPRIPTVQGGWNTCLNTRLHGGKHRQNCLRPTRQ